MKIGLTYTGTEAKHSNYVQWLKGTDEIEVIKLSAENSNDEMINNLDGIVISGGLDVHPKNYQQSTNYKNAPKVFDDARDEFETTVFNISQQNKLPLLGICRGMQLVNCILGGSLVQDIGDASNKKHRNEITDKAHAVNIEPGTLLNEIAAVKSTMVNSAHHQAINELGKGLKINCFDEGGMIEGIEWLDKKNKAFFLSVQWHPERMNQLQMGNSPLSKNIRDRFIDEIKKSISTKNENH